jgi:hypothetical protein
MISLYYNNIVLKDCVVKRFQQTVMRDESNTDVMYSRFMVTVESTLVEAAYQDVPLGVDPNAPRNAFISVPVQGDNVVDSMDQVARALSENRKDFWLICGGQTPGVDVEDREETLLIAAGALDVAGDPNIYRSPRFAGQGSTSRFQVIDVENGPQVEDVAIEQIYGGKAMRVSATFKIARSLCIEYDDPKPVDDYTLLPDANLGEILNNRWSISESKDANWATIRTISGTLRTRHADFFAQDYRSAVFPPLMQGYQRESQQFVSDPSNTTLKYQIVDRQRYAAPPAPAIEWEATHTESTTAQGANQVANFEITLTGNQNVDKKDLIAAAGNVLTKRIRDIQNEPQESDHKTILKEMAIIDQLHLPRITMRASVQYTTTDFTWLAMRVQTMSGGRGGNLTGPDGIDGYDPVIWPRPLAYDSETPAGQLACYLQSPCSQWHGMPGIQQEQPPRNDRPQEVPAYPPDSWEYPEPTPLPIDDTTWQKYPGSNVEAKYDVVRYPYTLYTIAATWETGMGRLHLPYSVEMADGLTAATLQVNMGCTRLIYEIEAVRTGSHPLMPAINDTINDENGIEFKLLHFTPTVRPPEITADGSTKSYGIALRLIYGGNKRLPLAAELNPGALPIDIVPATDTNATVAYSTISDDQDRVINSGTNA